MGKQEKRVGKNGDMSVLYKSIWYTSGNKEREERI